MIFARASDSVLSYSSRKSNFEHFCDQDGITALPSGVFLHILKRKIFFWNRAYEQSALVKISR